MRIVDVFWSSYKQLSMRTLNKQQDKCPLKMLLRHRFVIANEDSVCLFLLCLNGPTVLKKKSLSFPICTLGFIYLCQHFLSAFPET